MAVTWFKAETKPEDVAWMFKAPSLVSNPGTIREYVHFELFKNGEYQGWVFIKPDGTIEFGEPAA